MNLNIPCPFCSTVRKVIFETAMSFAILDGFPVSDGHTLIIPKRHTPGFFELSEEEQADCIRLLNKVKAYLEAKYRPDGFNVGVNVGEAAGQTVPHVHIHLIPRYAGDVPEPRGGVRGVIPDKRSY